MYRKIIWLILISSIVSASIVPFSHPETVEKYGTAYECFGTVKEYSIDNAIDDTSTFWCFTSEYGLGGEYTIQSIAGSNLESVTVKTISTGDKRISIKNNEGTFETIYDLPPSTGIIAEGTKTGNQYIQADGKIIVRITNLNQFAQHHISDITISYSYSETPSPSPSPSPTPVPSPLPTPSPSPTATPSPSPAPSPSPSPTPSPSPSPNPTPSPSPSSTPTPIPSPSPAPSPSSSPNPSLNPSPSLTPSPSVEPNVFPSLAVPSGSNEVEGSSYWPSIEPSPNPSTALFEEEIIDIVVGDELFVGFNEVIVLVNGEPTKGKIVFERDGASFDRELSSDGSVTFYFDEPGKWIISFGNATKEVQVKNRENYLPVIEIEEGFKEQAGVGPATGLVSAANVDWRWLLLLVLILGIAGATYEKVWRVVKIKKTQVNGQIQVTIKNRREKVTGLELIETVREEKPGEYSEEPFEVKETINGWALKWHKSELESGQEWAIKYASKTKPITPSELRFKDDNGKEHCVFS